MKRNRWIMTLVAAGVLVPAGILLAIRPGAAETFTERIANCLAEASDSWAECTEANDHENFLRRIWHQTRCDWTLLVNSAACFPEELLK
ncbi:MAG TPA: hypothetical protein VMK65_00235 [Longimicrobiales bacterium]|nr:hypothetical protein [Longimicrobiales bacterium]